MSHLVLFDGLNLAHRGFATNFGMLSTIAQNILRFTETATHAAFLFDSAEGREKRREVVKAFNQLDQKRGVDGYKIHRPPRTPDFIKQLKQAEAIVRAMGVSIVYSGAGEADDAIATFVRIGHEAKYKITVLTNDKDIYPVLEFDSCSIYNGHSMITAADIKKEYRFSPKQWVDYIALRGKQDQVPGVPGIGDSIARSLVSMYIDIPTIYRNLDQIRYDSEVIYSRLVENAELAVVSRRLAALDMNLGGLPDLDALRMAPRDVPELERLLRELRLFRVMARI